MYDVKQYLATVKSYWSLDRILVFFINFGVATYFFNLYRATSSYYYVFYLVIVTGFISTVHQEMRYYLRNRTEK